MERKISSQQKKILKGIIYIVTITISVIVSIFISLEFSNFMKESNFDPNIILLSSIAIVLIVYLFLLYFFYLMGKKIGFITISKKIDSDNIVTISEDEYLKISILSSVYSKNKSKINYNTPQYRKLANRSKSVTLFIYLFQIIWFVSLFLLYSSIKSLLTIEELLILSVFTLLVIVILNTYLTVIGVSNTLQYDKNEKEYSHYISTYNLVNLQSDMLLIIFLMIIIGYTISGLILLFLTIGLIFLYTNYRAIRVRRTILKSNEEITSSKINIYPARYPILFSFQMEIFSILVISSDLLEYIKIISKDISAKNLLDFCSNMLIVSAPKRIVFGIIKMMYPIFVAIFIQIIITPNPNNETLFIVLGVGFVVLYIGYFILGAYFNNTLFHQVYRNILLYLDELENSPNFDSQQIVNLLDASKLLFEYLRVYQVEKSYSILSYNIFSAFFSVGTFAEMEKIILKASRVLEE